MTAAQRAAAPGRVAGKVVVVTGATAGIGRGCALALAAEGARVVASGRNEADGNRTVELIREAGGEAIYVRQDVTVEAEWPATLDRAVAAYGRLDCLLNNAGQLVMRPIEVLAVENLHYELGLIVESCFLGIKHAMPVMARTGGGLILNMSSVGGLRGAINSTIYGPSKAAQIMLSRVAAIEGTRQGRNIRVNAICPGLVPGERFAKKNGPEAMRRYIEMGMERVPLKFLAEARDVGELVVYLVSDAAAAINGQTIVLDGGDVI